MPKGTNKFNTSADAIAYQEKLKKALVARKLGYNWNEIGEQVEMKPKTIQKAVSRLLKELIVDDAKDLRSVQYLQIQEVLTATIEKAKKGNLLAVDRLVKLWKREAELMGFDAPTKIAATDGEGNDQPAAQVVFYLPDNGRDGLAENAKDRTQTDRKAS